MDADRCVSCGVIIPEGSQVCINCMAGCVGCPWDDKDNCRSCTGQVKTKGKGGEPIDRN